MVLMTSCNKHQTSAQKQTAIFKIMEESAKIAVCF